MTNQKTLSTGVYTYEPYGSVKVTVRSQSRRITGRWAFDRLEVSVPPGLAPAELIAALDQWKPRFADRIAASSKGFYHLGQRLDFDHFSVSIVAKPSLRAGRIGVNKAGNVYEIWLSSDLDVSNSDVAHHITRMIERVADYEATGVIIKEAYAQAARLGVHPMGWQISRGHRVLGTCDRRGIIKLSHCLMFMPADLRQLIICHELAHLSELNHSPEFHRILDGYLGGREKELNLKLKNFKWPVYY